MSESVSVSSGIAQRDATALFDWARDAKALKSLDADADALEAALYISADLRGGVLMVEASKQVCAPTRGGLAAAVRKPLRVLEGVRGVSAPQPAQVPGV